MANNRELKKELKIFNDSFNFYNDETDYKFFVDRKMWWSMLEFNDKHYNYTINYDISEDKPYTITTYKEWLKYNPLKIEKVLITNKNGKGFIKLKNYIWKQLYARDDKKFDDEIMEDLRGFIKLINNDYDDITLDIEKIYEDTIKKCFVKQKDIKFYDKKNYEYLLICESNYNKTKFYMLDMLNFNFILCDDILKDQIYCYKRFSFNTFYLNVNLNINYQIIDELFNVFINEKIKTFHINNFRKLMYNILVQQIDGKIIFNDYENHTLTYILYETIQKMIPTKIFLYYTDYHTKKIKDISEYKCVIIENCYDQNTIEDEINYFYNLGIKNFIIKYKKFSENIIVYDLQKLKNYLIDNSTYIINIINNQNLMKIVNKSSPDYEDEIFCKNDYLLINFLKWSSEYEF